MAESSAAESEGHNPVTAETIDEICQHLGTLPKDMRDFSLGLRSLYAEREIQSTSPYAADFNKFRDKIKREAMFYMKVLNPFNVALVRCLKDFVELYEVIDFEEWNDNLGDLVSDVNGYRILCKRVKHEHEQILIPLKVVEDEVNVLVGNVKNLNEEMEEVKSDLLQSVIASCTATGVVGVLNPATLFVSLPIASLIATVALLDAAVIGSRAKVNDAAIFVLSQTMVPALKVFIKSIGTLAGFFNSIHQELISMHARGSQDGRKEMHYKLMRTNASEIKKKCQVFSLISPQVTTDLEAINKRTGDVAVTKWVEERGKKLVRNFEEELGGLMSQLSLKQ